MSYEAGSIHATNHPWIDPYIRGSIAWGTVAGLAEGHWILYCYIMYHYMTYYYITYYYIKYYYMTY